MPLTMGFYCLVGWGRGAGQNQQLVLFCGHLWMIPTYMWLGDTKSFSIRAKLGIFLLLHFFPLLGCRGRDLSTPMKILKWPVVSSPVITRREFATPSGKRRPPRKSRLVWNTVAQVGPQRLGLKDEGNLRRAAFSNIAAACLTWVRMLLFCFGKPWVFSII